MEKDFDTWNEVKKQTNNRTHIPFFHEREIWWVRLGINVGFEQDGSGKKFIRPVVVIRVFNRNTFLGVGLTGRRKFGEHYFYLGEINSRDSTANLSQIRLIDARRLIKKIGTLDENTFGELQNILKRNLFP